MNYGKAIVILFVLSFIVINADRVFSQDDLLPEIQSLETAIDEEFKWLREELLGMEITTASRSEKSVKKLPITVHVVTRKEIMENNYTTLVDAVKDIPGIKVSQPGSGTEGETFLMRGLFGNYYTKILMNGMPLMPSVTSGISEQINMKNIERIEVIYGPASALYGADAVAGVINIITHVPEKTEVRAETKIGEHGYWYKNVFGSYSLGKGENRTQFTLYGLHNKYDRNITDGYEDVYDRGTYEKKFPYMTGWNSVPFALGDLESESWSFGTQLSFRNFRFSYDHMYRSDHSSIGQQSVYYLYDDKDAIWGETIQRALLQHEGKTARFTFKTNLSYLKYRLDNESYFAFIFPTRDPDTFGQLNKAYKYQASDDLLFEETVVWDFSENLEFVGGISYQYSGVLPKTNDLAEPFNEDDYSPFSHDKPAPDPVFGEFGYNPDTFDNMAIFLQSSYSSERFDVMLGARYDKHSDYGSTFNPRVAGQYHIAENTSIRASYSEAFKSPTSYYTYMSVAGLNADGTINYMYVPNSDLQPEELKSYELGLRHLITKNISSELVGYYNRIEKLISSSLQPLDPQKYPNAGNTEARIFTNDGDASTTVKAVDLILRMKNIIPAIRLNSDLYITYIQGEETLPGRAGEIDELRMSPAWMGKLRLSFRPVEKLYIGIDNIYCEDWYSREIASKANFDDPYYEIKGFYIMDVTANYEIIKNLKIHGEAQNLFDEKYAGIQAYRAGDLKYNPQPGRNFYFGVEYSF